MDKYLPFILLIVSAIFRSLDQIMRWKQQDQTWLPEWIWTWHIGDFKALDAEHVYMGLKLTLACIGMHILNFQPWWAYPLIWFGYYQIFNLFFHIIWKLNLGS
jgi:hypothetical protein